MIISDYSQFMLFKLHPDLIFIFILFLFLLTSNDILLTAQRTGSRHRYLIYYLTYNLKE